MDQWYPEVGGLIPDQCDHVKVSMRKILNRDAASAVAQRGNSAKRFEYRSSERSCDVSTNAISVCLLYVPFCICTSWRWLSLLLVLQVYFSVYFCGHVFFLVAYLIVPYLRKALVPKERSPQKQDWTTARYADARLPVVEFVLENSKKSFSTHASETLRITQAGCRSVRCFASAGWKPVGAFSLHPAQGPCTSTLELIKQFRALIELFFQIFFNFFCSPLLMPFWAYKYTIEPY